MSRIIDVRREVILRENRNNYGAEILALFNGADRFILYHGTSSNFLGSIRERGILARQFTGNSTYWGQTIGDSSYESQQDLVYLAGLMFAQSLGSPIRGRHGGDLVVIRCLIDKKDLLPDEDSKKMSGIESLAYTQTVAVRDRVLPDRLLGLHTRGDIYISWQQVNADLVTFDEATFPKFFDGEILGQPIPKH